MQTERLSTQRQAESLRALRDEWQRLNWAHFASQMREPVLAFTEAQGVLARWVSERRTIEFSLDALGAQPWLVLLEVLKHEMAHQYVDEVLKIHEETAHGPTFRRVCNERGFDARAAGVPEEVARSASAVLDRVARLLALAQSPNEHEAQTAMNTAQRLMLKHNLDALTAQERARYTVMHLGEPSGRVDASMQLLGTILQEHFFVQVLWVPVWLAQKGQRASVMELAGTGDNLALASYVYSFLHHTADGLWRAHKAAHRVQGDRDRRAFRVGVMLGFREKLEAERRGNQERGLVWLGDPGLESFYQRRNPRLRSVQRATSGSASARERGREAGRKVVLHKGVEAGGGRAVVGRLGPGGGKGR